MNFDGISFNHNALIYNAENKTMIDMPLIMVAVCGLTYPTF